MAFAPVVNSSLETSPEMRLLLECAQTLVCPAIEARIRDHLSANLNWDALIAMSGDHATLTLLERSLRLVAPDLVPEAAKERLAAGARASAFRGLRLTGELIGVLGAFEAARILALPYKGPIVAM